MESLSLENTLHPSETEARDLPPPVQEYLHYSDRQIGFLSSIIEHSIDAITAFDSDFRMILWNKSAEKLTGMTREQAIGKSLAEIYPGVAGGEFEKLARRALKGEKINITERPYIHMHGYYEAHLIPLLDESGTTIGVVSIVHDITRFKETEKALQEKNQELTRSNQELEHFAYVASHDLREPLRMVSSFARLLVKRYANADKEAEEFSRYITQGINTLNDLINDLLEYSRVGRSKDEFSLVNCNEAIGQALEGLHLKIEESGTRITADGLPTISGKAALLLRLFQNLIENAIKFRTESPPEISISAEERANDWLFAVKDNGIGIDKAYTEKVFVLFQRLHTRDKYPGTGIGLAICKKIVELHGGHIWFESSKGEGTTFYFTLAK